MWAKEALLKAASAAKVMAHDGKEWVVDETKQHPYIAGAIGAGVVGVVGYVLVSRKEAHLKVEELKSVMSFFVEQGRKDPQRKYLAGFDTYDKKRIFDQRELVKLLFFAERSGDGAKTHKRPRVILDNKVLNLTGVLNVQEIQTCGDLWARYEDAVYKKELDEKNKVEKEIRTFLQIPVGQPLPFE